MAKDKNAPAAAEETAVDVVTDQSAHAEQPETDQPAADKKTAAAPVGQVTLNEFCIRLSKKEKRVELIGGFEFEERNAKRLKDTEENYSARFQDFIKKPA